MRYFTSLENSSGVRADTWVFTFAATMTFVSLFFILIYALGTSGEGSFNENIELRLNEISKSIAQDRWKYWRQGAISASASKSQGRLETWSVQIRQQKADIESLKQQNQTIWAEKEKSLVELNQLKQELLSLQQQHEQTLQEQTQLSDDLKKSATEKNSSFANYQLQIEQLKKQMQSQSELVNQLKAENKSLKETKSTVTLPKSEPIEVRESPSQPMGEPASTTSVTPKESKRVPSALSAPIAAPVPESEKIKEDMSIEIDDRPPTP